MDLKREALEIANHVDNEVSILTRKNGNYKELMKLVAEYIQDFIEHEKVIDETITNKWWKHEGVFPLTETE